MPTTLLIDIDIYTRHLDIALNMLNALYIMHDKITFLPTYVDILLDMYTTFIECRQCRVMLLCVLNIKI